MAAKKKPMKKVPTPPPPPDGQDGGRQRAIARAVSKMNKPQSGFFIDKETGRRVDIGNIAGFGRQAAEPKGSLWAPEYFAGNKYWGKKLTQFDADVWNRVSQMAFEAEKRRRAKYGHYGPPTGFGGPTPAQLKADANKRAGAKKNVGVKKSVGKMK